MGDIGFSEILLIGVIAILVYGKDLPSVTRKVGRYYMKIRRYLADMKDEIARQIPEDEPEAPPARARLEASITPAAPPTRPDSPVGSTPADDGVVPPV